MRTACIALVASVLLASCCSVKNRRFGDSGLLPRVHTIGVHPVLAFHEDQDLAIPIDGANLADPSIRWSLHVQGVRQLIEGQDYAFDLVDGAPLTLLGVPRPKDRRTLNRSSVVLKISRKYLKHVESGDPLRVSIALTEGRFQDLQVSVDEIVRTSGADRRKAAEQAITLLASITTAELGVRDELEAAIDKLLATTACNDVASIRTISSLRQALRGKQTVLSYSTRKFVLYKAQEYRDQYLKTRVPVGSIHAFPLSSQETVDLFGQLVENMYFVVKLSVENHRSEDLLINTGMIRAYGTATVGDDRESWITFPVEIAPQSLQHVYAVVRDNKHERLRERVFRFFDFTGELGTAVSGVWGTQDLVQAFGLYTGVFVPELAKLWTDPVPGYLANLVNFSFPDLVKVPTGATVTHKYLFFSKLDLQAMLPGAAPAFSSWPIANSVWRSLDVELPAYDPESARIGYLAFDALDIPFDLVSPAVETPIEKRMQDAKARLESALSTANAVKVAWLDAAKNNAAYPYGSSKKLEHSELDALTKQLEAVVKELSAKIDPKKDDEPTKLYKRALPALTTLKRACEQIAHDKVLAVVTKKGPASIDQITANLFDLNRFLAEISRGVTPSRFLEPAQAIDSQAGVAHRTYVLYDSLAAIASQLVPIVADLASELKKPEGLKKLDDAKVKTFEEWATRLVHLAESTTEVAIDAASPEQTLPQTPAKVVMKLEARGAVGVPATEKDLLGVSSVVRRGADEFVLIGDRGSRWPAKLSYEGDKLEAELSEKTGFVDSAESSTGIGDRIYVATEKEVNDDKTQHRLLSYDKDFGDEKVVPGSLPDLTDGKGIEAMAWLTKDRLLMIAETGDAWYVDLAGDGTKWSPVGHTFSVGVDAAPRGATTLADGSVLVLFQNAKPKAEKESADYEVVVLHYAVKDGEVEASGNRVEIEELEAAAYEGITAWQTDDKKKELVLLVSDNAIGDRANGETRIAQFELVRGVGKSAATDKDNDKDND